VAGAGDSAKDRPTPADRSPLDLYAVRSRPDWTSVPTIAVRRIRTARVAVAIHRGVVAFRSAALATAQAATKSIRDAIDQRRGMITPSSPPDCEIVC